MDGTDDAGNVVAATLGRHLDVPRLGIAYVVQVYAVDVIAARYLFAYIGQVARGLRTLRVHVAIIAYLAEHAGVGLAQVTAAGAVPLAYGYGHYPGVELHAAAVALVDGIL